MRPQLMPLVTLLPEVFVWCLHRSCVVAEPAPAAPGSGADPLDCHGAVRTVLCVCSKPLSRSTQWACGRWRAGCHADSVCGGEGDRRARHHWPRCGSRWRCCCLAVLACCNCVRAQARLKRWGPLSHIGLLAEVLCVCAQHVSEAWQARCVCTCVEGCQGLLVAATGMGAHAEGGGIVGATFFCTVELRDR
jgi:hypothetical protein